MSNQSETNKFFNELKGLAEDFDSLRKENAELRAEVERLNSIIISGGAVVPDAKPFEE